MKEIIVLSSIEYDNADATNYGDCILINCNSQLTIYDCGHEEHANYAIKYMDEHNIPKATIILSHNDGDHFDGIPTLIKADRVDKIYTTLLLKHLEDIETALDDKRCNKNSIINNIKNKFDNIASLSGESLFDAYSDYGDLVSISDSVAFVGPDYDSMIDTVAKNLDGRLGNSTDGETNVNATSLIVQVDMGTIKVLLTGDCPFSSIESLVRDYNCLQLPHHGKAEQANEIFKAKFNQIGSSYFVSDNTGNSNGGCDARCFEGYDVKVTRIDGNIVIQESTETKISPRPIGSYAE